MIHVQAKREAFSETAWLDSASWEQSRHLENLGKFLERFCRNSNRSAPLAWAPEGPGTPHTIMLTGAALRAANLARYGSTQTLSLPLLDRGPPEYSPE